MTNNTDFEENNRPENVYDPVTINAQSSVEQTSAEYYERDPSTFFKVFFPSLLFLFLFSGFTQVKFDDDIAPKKVYAVVETNQAYYAKLGEFNILSEEDLGGNILDTVYTDKDNWLELRIHEQYVYQHWRDGHVVRYPVSTGNKLLEKGLESRPGLFAVFVKEEHHESSQFDNADMYHFMPFNQGIGFHSINGTGYYGFLGVRPSSHGCIRMRHEDVKKMFGETELGTLVLAHRGYSARTVAFAPEGYDAKKEQNYTKEEYQRMLAENLYNVINGKYYISEKKFFVVDPTIIPKSGVYTSYDVHVPDRQQLPKETLVFKNDVDDLRIPVKNVTASVSGNENIFDETSWIVDVSNKNNDKKSVTSTDDLVKKYFSNPIGVLPYFPPTGGVVKKVASN